MGLERNDIEEGAAMRVVVSAVLVLFETVETTKNKSKGEQAMTAAPALNQRLLVSG